MSDDIEVIAIDTTETSFNIGQKYQVTYENFVTGGVSMLVGVFQHWRQEDAVFIDATGKTRYVRESAIVKVVER